MNAVDSRLVQILDLARWAPSGDNTQPWRFEVLNDLHLVVHGFDTRSHCVYDLDGRPSQISLGALLETLEIAATSAGMTAQAQRRLDAPDTTPTFDIHLAPQGQLDRDPLVDHIKSRSVQRRPLSTQVLLPEEKLALQTAVGGAYDLEWFETPGDRWRVALLMFANAKLRLTLPEAYPVHKAVIEWGARESEDRVPDQALGVDALTLRLMRFVMGSWKRVQFFNRYLAGTVAPRLQMDLLPGVACGAHFVLRAKERPVTIDDFVAAGRAVQRFWLTATGLGLLKQPELTPLIFGSYVRRGLAFTQDAQAMVLAQRLEKRAQQVIGGDLDRAVWMGRLGRGMAPWARSVRRPLARLMQDSSVPSPVAGSTN